MGLGFLSGRREGRVVGMRGRGCGFFCWVAYGCGLLVEWGRTVLGWFGPSASARGLSSFGD